MKNNQIHDVAVAVLNFLVKSEEEFLIYDDFKTPSLVNMDKKLKPYNMGMCEFTIYINDKFNILPKPIWIDSPKELFSNDDKIFKFYEDVINITSRKNKINRLLKL